MKHRIHEILAVMVVSGLSAACGSDHMGDDDAGALRGEIQSARVEVTRHHDAVLASPTLPEVVVEVDRHDQRMGGIMDRMNGMMGGMSHCSGTGMGRVHEGMGGMDSEMRSHAERMGKATTLEETRPACTAHTDSMNGMLDDMHAGLRDMGCMADR